MRTVIYEDDQHAQFNLRWRNNQCPNTVEPRYPQHERVVSSINLKYKFSSLEVSFSLMYPMVTRKPEYFQVKTYRYAPSTSRKVWGYQWVNQKPWIEEMQTMANTWFYCEM